VKGWRWSCKECDFDLCDQCVAVIWGPPSKPTANPTIRPATEADPPPPAPMGQKLRREGTLVTSRIRQPRRQRPELKAARAEVAKGEGEEGAVVPASILMRLVDDLLAALFDKLTGLYGVLPLVTLSCCCRTMRASCLPRIVHEVP
jgi:hypothetical protein